MVLFFARELIHQFLSISTKRNQILLLVLIGISRRIRLYLARPYHHKDWTHLIIFQSSNGHFTRLAFVITKTHAPWSISCHAEYTDRPPGSTPDTRGRQDYREIWRGQWCHTWWKYHWERTASNDPQRYDTRPPSTSSSFRNRSMFANSDSEDQAARVG